MSDHLKLNITNILYAVIATHDRMRTMKYDTDKLHKYDKIKFRSLLKTLFNNR